MSFMGVPGFVQDSQQNGLFTVFFLGVHGFRMPLFFLISGFFTAMLWRRRGLSALFWHRFKRIFLPCLIGLFTIVPAVTLAAIVAKAITTDVAAGNAGGGLIQAVRKPDIPAVKKAIAGGADVNAAGSAMGVTPLAWSAMQKDTAMLQILLENGAEVNGRNNDGGTALHAAAFLGRVEAVQLLLEAGADANAKNNAGHTPFDSTMAPWAMTKMIAGAIKIETGSRKQLTNRRVECRKLLFPYLTEEKQLAVGGAAMTGPIALVDEGDAGGGLREAYAAFLLSDAFKIRLGGNGSEYSLTMSPLFHHLWFLWFLCWLLPFFGLYAWLANATGWQGKHWLVRRLVAGPWRMLWLIPLTMIPQWFMGVLTPIFGPDTSVGLLPHPHVLVYYGVFFGFGALYFDADDADGRLGRWWWLLLPAAMLIAFPVGAIASFTGWHAMGGFFQVFYAWAMSFGLIGLCRQLLRKENGVIRYVSDSSYWLYLAHMPLVILLQAVVCDWPLWSFVKFGLICGVTTGLLLLTYRYFVRYTLIGWLLNGPRKPSSASSQEVESIEEPPGTESVDAPAEAAIS